MATQYKIIAKIVHLDGVCSMGMKKGDEFVIDDITPKGMCSWAFYTIFPFYSVLKYGGTFPWDSDPDKTVVACPDPQNIVHFELRREKL
jgi:uncharacterized repeat protein (TIGR04076 family)